jgi:hypothetical protein
MFPVQCLFDLSNTTVKFDVHGSEHLGKIHFQFKFQLDVLFMYILFFFILSSTCFGCYLNPSSGAQLQRTAIGVCMIWYVSLLEQVLAGTPSHF